MRDLKYAIRQLVKHPGFTAVAVLSLALGIGANTAVFSVVNAVLLRPLPYGDPGRLVTVCEKNDGRGYSQFTATAANFLAWRERATVFKGLAAEVFGTFNIGTESTPVHANGAVVTANYFSVLGARFSQGRGFETGEDESGRHHVAVISHGLWQRSFGGRADIVGQTITADDERYTVVGVLAPEFRVFNPRSVMGRPTAHFEPQIWMPYPFTPEERQGRWHYFVGIGRLKPDVSVPQAQAEMDQIAAALAQANPDQTGWGASVTPLHEQVVRQSRPALRVLFGAVGFVLLIACANVANLFLMRGVGRQKEFAIRAAVGARGLDLIRPVLIESLLLAAVGGLLGVLLAQWILTVVPMFAPPDMPRIDEIRMNRTVLGFTITISAVVGVLAGLIPAWQCRRTDPHLALQTGQRGMTAAGRIVGWRYALAVAQVALAMALLTGAGLLIRSFQELAAVHPGFDRERVLALDLSLPSQRYGWDFEDASKRLPWIAALAQHIAALPGVESAATVHGLPFGAFVEATPRVTIDGESFTTSDSAHRPGYREASPGYFKTMRIPVIRGREFLWSDTTNAPSVALVNESLAKRLFGESNPIGRRINVALINTNQAEIVGVVADVKLTGLDAPARPEVYLSHSQRSLWMISLVARTRADPLALSRKIEAEILTLDKDMPAYNIRTLEQAVAGSVAPRRFIALLAGGFGLVALGLALVGIFGVLSSSVAHRHQEWGIRLALGAQRRQILAQVLRQGMLLALAGMAIGLAGSFALTRFISSQLFEVTATDPITFAAAIGLLVLAVVAACLIPAWRATRIDPMQALRCE